jgi:hypothetical protein
MAPPNRACAGTRDMMHVSLCLAAAACLLRRMRDRTGTVPVPVGSVAGPCDACPQLPRRLVPSPLPSSLCSSDPVPFVWRPAGVLPLQLSARATVRPRPSDPVFVGFELEMALLQALVLRSAGC